MAQQKQEPIRYWYQLRDVLGVTSAQRLIDLEAGRVFFLARSPQGALVRRIAEICGEETAEACRRRFCGGSFRIPSNALSLRKRLIFDYLDEHASGRSSIQELSRKTGIPASAFYSHLNNLRACT